MPAVQAHIYDIFQQYSRLYQLRNKCRRATHSQAAKGMGRGHVHPRQHLLRALPARNDDGRLADRKTYALVGYRFYHDESKNDGEYIVLEGEASGAGLKLPKTRKWYRHEDDGFLGTDIIESMRRP